MSLRIRRSPTALELLGQQAGTGIVLAGNLDAMPAHFNDRQRAMAYAGAGYFALTLMIETTGKPKPV